MIASLSDECASLRQKVFAARPLNDGERDRLNRKIQAQAAEITRLLDEKSNNREVTLALELEVVSMRNRHRDELARMRERTAGTEGTDA